MSEDAQTPADLHKILVVDDEPDLESLVKQRMRREIRGGVYHFEFANNGEEALEKLQQVPDVDVVLTDINMPKMDGLTLLSRLEELDQELRSVVVSAYGDMKNIRTAMNLGAFDFIVKPVDFNDLRVTIDRTVKNLDSWREALNARNQLVSIQNELEVAKAMQVSILPTNFPSAREWRLHAHMEAAREVGGDFYDFYHLPGGRLGIAIADVSGKGVPAALFMMVSRTLLKSTALEGSDPAEVLRTVNDILCADNDSMMFVTMIYAIYDPSTEQLTYCNGGHNPFLLVHENGQVDLRDPHDGIALGVATDFEFTQHRVQMRDGDLLVLYTDGVNEAENSNEELFGMSRFFEVFEQERYRNPQEASDAIFRTVHQFAGNYPQSDDITCLTLYAGSSNS